MPLSRKVLEYQLESVRVFSQQLLEVRLQPRTILSLVIHKGDERDRCILRAPVGSPGYFDLMDKIDP